MSQQLPTTSFALLGLLALGDGLTGYELKQRADRTMRFYWVSPAMSQIYTELDRLAQRRLVRTRETKSPTGARTRRHYLTAAGRAALRDWLAESTPEFPVLKHPVALRLMLGHLAEPGAIEKMLDGYLQALQGGRADLAAVRDSLRGRDNAGDPYFYPSLVADWGLAFFDSEQAAAEKVLARLRAETGG